jgi:hypothetical protein
MKAQNNPHAFPYTDGQNVYHDGMTLRDYFANSAMQGAIICVEEILGTYDSKNRVYPKEFIFWQEVLTILKEM